VACAPYPQHSVWCREAICSSILGSRLLPRRRRRTPDAPGHARVQVVSLHCNLDENTKHLINAERLGMMKPDAVLVNASRGPVIDETALVAHLQANPEFRRARLPRLRGFPAWLGLCWQGKQACRFLRKACAAYEMVSS